LFFCLCGVIAKKGIKVQIEHLQLPLTMVLNSDSVQRGVFTETWRGLTLGDNLAELEGLSTYPDQPDSQQTEMKMKLNGTLEGKIGVRSRTYFVSPMNGEHMFGMACVDKCRLTLKEGEDYSENLLQFSDVHHPNNQK